MTHYGETYNGHKMGCAQMGYYASDDPTIVAVSEERAAEMPCGTLLQVCGPAGCSLMARKDSCPGCGAYVFDLSEAGIARVCGVGSGVCKATVTKVTVCQNFTLALSRPKPSNVLTEDEVTLLAFSLTSEATAETPSAPTCAAGGNVSP